MTAIDRRAFIRRGAALAGGLVVAGPLQAYAANVAEARPSRGKGYGELRLAEGGDLRLPKGFRYRVISQQGRTMSDGNPTPGICDGMAAFTGPRGSTILMRNHENRNPFFPGSQFEIPVVVSGDKRYDRNPIFNAGVTKLVVSEDLRVVRDFAVLGGTTTNCAGGRTPWGSWITCEEFFFPSPDAEVFEDADLDVTEPHGYIFEIDASTERQVQAVPIKTAGHFFHEAVAWRDGILYETEDNAVGNLQDAVAYYRYIPERMPRRVGDLAATAGTLQALKVAGEPNADLRTGVPVGEPLPIEWVTIADPNPPDDSVRQEAFSKGAARFTREEGTWSGNGRIYFDCTDGGDNGTGQVFELDPGRQALTMVYESPDESELDFPDNLVVAPTGDLFLCENGTPPDFVRGLTPGGRIYDFAQAVTNETEFAGACFSPDGRTLFLNQNGGRGPGEPPGVTYAIWGPFEARSDPDPDDDRPRPHGGRPGDGPRGGSNPTSSDRSGGSAVGREAAAGPAQTADANLGAATAAGGDGELPFTGFPLIVSGGAAAVLIATGAVLRRRVENARRSSADA